MTRNKYNLERISNEKVIEVMDRVPRHSFIDEKYQGNALENRPLPIDEGQTISQPYIVAAMTEALELIPGDKVLEIGTGSGYQTAILAEMKAVVYSIEVFESLSSKAKTVLSDLNYKGIHLRVGDGFKGWPEHAPYDAIIVTAAPTEVPPELVHQLKVGGKLVIPVGDKMQTLLRITKNQTGFSTEELMPVRFVPMVPKNEV